MAYYENAVAAHNFVFLADLYNIYLLGSSYKASD